MRKKSGIHRGIEVVHFGVSVLIAKVVTLWAQEQEEEGVQEWR